MKSFVVGSLTAATLSMTTWASAEDNTTEEEGTQEAESEEADEKKDKKKKNKHFVIGLDGHGVVGTDDNPDNVGGGFSGRMGFHHTKLKIFAYRPELGVGYIGLPNANLGRVSGGARLGIQAIIGLYAYGHAGYGWTSGSNGFSYDVGMALDFVLLSIIRPGIHVEYMEIKNTFDAVQAGLHIDFAF